MVPSFAMTPTRCTVPETRACLASGGYAGTTFRTSFAACTSPPTGCGWLDSLTEAAGCGTLGGSAMTCGSKDSVPTGNPNDEPVTLEANGSSSAEIVAGLRSKGCGSLAGQWNG